MASMAESVVIDRDDFTFLVDGEPFPWFIAEGGPKPRQLSDDLYAVWVSIYPVSRKSPRAPMAFEHYTNPQEHPIIGGIEFPWFITEDGFAYRSSRGAMCTVDLAFLTRSVEVHGLDVEARPSRLARVGNLVVDVEDNSAVWDFQGRLWKRPRQEAQNA